MKKIKCSNVSMGQAFLKKKIWKLIFRLEEAKRRDHRRLGKELGLYSFVDEAPGFPVFHPKGMVLRNQIETFWRQVPCTWWL